MATQPTLTQAGGAQLAQSPSRTYRSRETRIAQEKSEKRRRGLLVDTELSAKAIAAAVELYATNEKDNEFLSRIAVRPDFTVFLSSAKLSIFLLFVVCLVMAVMVFLVSTEESSKGYNSYMILLFSSCIVISIFVILFVSSYNMARADLRSHDEFTQYVVGKVVYDELIQKKDLRSILIDLENNTQPESSRQRIQSFMSGVALTGPEGMYALATVIRDKRRSTKLGSAMFWGILVLVLAAAVLAVVVFLKGWRRETTESTSSGAVLLTETFGMEKESRIMTYVSGGSVLLALVLLVVMYFKYYKLRYVSVPERYEIAADSLAKSLKQSGELPTSGIGSSLSPEVADVVARTLRARPEAQAATASLALQGQAARQQARTLGAATASAFG
jgi:hypothetical protein